MNTQRKIIFAVLIAIIMLVIFFQRDGNTLSVTVHVINEKTSLVDIHIEYPEFPQLSKAFNVHIKKTIEDDLIKFKRSVSKNESLRNAPQGKNIPPYQYTFLLRWSPETLTPDLVSIILRSEYYIGGTQGEYGLHTFTYDIKKKKEVSLDNLFSLVPDYLMKISQYTANDLKNQRLQVFQGQSNIDMIQSGTASVIENFVYFTLNTQKSITFYFPPSQVAPYVAGEQKVTMPLSYIISPHNPN